MGSIPGSGSSPGGGHGNPLQYSCLENPMDRGAWWATVHGVEKSWTWLNWLSAHAHVGLLRNISQFHSLNRPADGWEILGWDTVSLQWRYFDLGTVHFCQPICCLPTPLHFPGHVPQRATCFTITEVSGPKSKKKKKCIQEKPHRCSKTGHGLRAHFRAPGSLLSHQQAHWPLPLVMTPSSVVLSDKELRIPFSDTRAPWSDSEHVTECMTHLWVTSGHSSGEQSCSAEMLVPRGVTVFCAKPPSPSWRSHFTVCGF